MRVGTEFDFAVSVDDDLNPGEPKERPISRRRVAAGNAFEAKISFGEKSAEAEDAGTRTRIVWFVLSMCALFLLGAAALGFRDGQFSALVNVWSVVGPIYGGIAAYYFFVPSRRR